MRLGPPEAEAAGRAPVPVERPSIEPLQITACGFDEPVRLSLRLFKDGAWKAAHRTLPNWVEAVKAAHVVMQRVPSLKKSLDQGYWSDWATGGYHPKTPWHVSADAETILSLWPERYYQNYEARLRACCAHPLPGDEHLRPKGEASTN